MYKRFAALCLLLCALLCLNGCYAAYELVSEPDSIVSVETVPAETAAEEAVSEETTEPEETEALKTEAAEIPEQTYPEAEDEPLPASVEKNGSYTTPEEVAEYIHTFGTLPGNFITKKEAQNLGWVSSKGNLWEVAPGKSIGGDYFGNYEGLLPDGNYHECDVNFDGGYRGSERIIYGDDGSIWYTNDHYESFTQLY